MAPDDAAGGRRIVRGACPHDCPDTCAMLVTVERGRAVAVRGAPDHPPTQGALCTKVARYLDRTYSPERVLHPMKRVGPKGAGAFERIGWDEAIATIARRFRELADSPDGDADQIFQTGAAALEHDPVLARREQQRSHQRQDPDQSIVDGNQHAAIARDVELSSRWTLTRDDVLRRQKVGRIGTDLKVGVGQITTQKILRREQTIARQCDLTQQEQRLWRLRTAIGLRRQAVGCLGIAAH
jgi:hypothetical protein